MDKNKYGPHSGDDLLQVEIDWALISCSMGYGLVADSGLRPNKTQNTNDTKVSRKGDPDVVIRCALIRPNESFECIEWHLAQQIARIQCQPLLFLPFSHSGYRLSWGNSGFLGYFFSRRHDSYELSSPKNSIVRAFFTCLRHCVQGNPSQNILSLLFHEIGSWAPFACSILFIGAIIFCLYLSLAVRFFRYPCNQANA